MLDDYCKNNYNKDFEGKEVRTITNKVSSQQSQLHKETVYCNKHDGMNSVFIPPSVKNRGEVTFRSVPRGARFRVPAPV